jgi:hypothetical protein
MIINYELLVIIDLLSTNLRNRYATGNPYFLIDLGVALGDIYLPSDCLRKHVSPLSWFKTSILSNRSVLTSLVGIHGAAFAGSHAT